MFCHYCHTPYPHCSAIKELSIFITQLTNLYMLCVSAQQNTNLVYYMLCNYKLTNAFLGVEENPTLTLKLPHRSKISFLYAKCVSLPFLTLYKRQRNEYTPSFFDFDLSCSRLMFSIVGPFFTIFKSSI